MGIAGAVVAVVAATAALVISPAMFGLWGAKLGRKRPRAASDTGRWYRLSHAVMRRPGAVAVATGVVMLALAAPALRAEWTPIDSSVIPTDKSSRTVADAVAADFGGTGGSPMTIAVTTDGDGGRRGRRGGVRRARSTPCRAWWSPVRRSSSTPPPGSSTSPPRASPTAPSPSSWSRTPGRSTLEGAIDAMVAGPAADFVDQQSAIGSRLPLAVGLLVALTLLVLWLMTGSVVLPVKAVLMNALTVAARAGRPDLRLPGRPADRAARLHAQRRDRADRLPGHGDADLRAVDRLRRVPARPDQGGPRQRAGRARVGGGRPAADRRGGHRGRDPAGGGDRVVQHELDLVHPADRHRDGVRRPDRRVRGPVAAGARR